LIWLYCMGYRFYKVMKYPIPKQKEFFVSVDSVFDILNNKYKFEKIKFSDHFNLNNEKSYNNKILDEFVDFINKYWWLYRNLPFVKQIRLCNSITFWAVSEDSDIDLFIICKKNRLWLCRFFTVLIFWILRLSRRSKKEAKKFDLWFYVTEDNLNLYWISLKPVDRYLVYWIGHLVLLYTNKELSEDELRRLAEDNIFVNNSWIKNILPNHPLRQVINLWNKVFTWRWLFKNFIEKILWWRIWDFLENLIKFIRLPLMIRKKEKMWVKWWGIIISDKMLKFHWKDIRKKVNLLMRINWDKLNKKVVLK